MAEEKYDLNGEDGMKIKKGRFGLWFENFWYHYKWHTIITVFVIFVVTICTVQMCSKEEYDVHIIYAGSENVRGKKAENDLSMYEMLSKSLNEAAEDFDENGKVNSSLEALYMLTAPEIAEVEKMILETKPDILGLQECSALMAEKPQLPFSGVISSMEPTPSGVRA